MSFGGFDPEILQDFLTESGELLETLEGDLVGLEKDPANLDLINRVFRALHTIKGSASFLALTNLVKIAHVAESALNAARNQTVTVDHHLMDLLLQAVDILKVQMTQIREGKDLVCPPDALVEELAAIGEGKQAPSPTATTEPARAGTTTAQTVANGRTITRLDLPAGKADLLEFLVADIEETIGKITGHCASLASDATRPAASAELATLSEELSKAVAFFDFDCFTSLAASLRDAAENAEATRGDGAEQIVPRLLAICKVLSEQCAGLKKNELIGVAMGQMLGRLDDALNARDLGAGRLPKGCDADQAMAFDGVGGGTPQESASSDAASTAATTASPVGTTPTATKTDEAGAKGAATSVESTIRVEVNRLEALMNLVGELVLQKNRVNAMARKLNSEQAIAGDTLEAVAMAAGSLDRVTADIQAAVMRTRMQPLERLFSKYPRLIRDLATKTGKKMQLVIEGGDTEVDKSVIEELGDPLVHLLRNSADHGIESPEAREAAGKPASGTITLRASHEGSQVRVLVIDDGKGLHRDRIAAKAVERGLATAEQVAGMTEREVFRFIFEPGFSTAEKVSDLSGRGVGMDVVRTNIERLKGAIELSSQPGVGTTISITIPLTVAILPAMMVGVRGEVFAIPLTNILEIVKPESAQLYTIGERPVMRLRDSVLPLVNAAEALGLASNDDEVLPFAVVLTMNDQRIGLLVSRLIGQQEVVIKPIDEGAARRRSMVSGATVRDDGGVSLIVDVAELMRQAQGALVVA
jgi:two-component system chemotaxis sensor kinase CheA